MGIAQSLIRRPAIQGINDPYWASVALLLHCDGADGSTTLTDSSLNPVTPFSRMGSAQIDTAQSKFGGASAYVNATGDYWFFTTPSKLLIGTGDFTVEGWVYLNVVTSISAFVTLNNSAPSWFTAFGRDADKLAWWPQGGSAANFGTSKKFTTGQWQHWAICRASGVVRGYIDGVHCGTSINNANDLVRSTSEPSHIGESSFTNNCWLDEIRITIGVARYTGTGSFTPPSAAFPGT